MKQNDIYYEAMLARDHRFDGKFFIGVKTTGIYCRPICPAKPKKENVEFFSSHLAAEKAGYRPCMRCRPESAPLSPVWIGKSAMVQRAIRIIHQDSSLNFDEDKFADLFGVTARHLRRVFQEEVGKTPKQLFSENRLNLARKLISETSLPLTEVAYASGFKSIRRFNQSYKDRFKKSPRETRKNTELPHHSTIHVTLPYRPPYDFEGLLGFYKNHQMGDLESFSSGQMIRIISFGGKVGRFQVQDDPKNSRLLVEIDFPDTTHLHKILSQIRATFDLDSDPLIVSEALSQGRDMKPLLKKHPGIRIPTGWDGFEIAISTILGQLVSVKQGRTLVKDLMDLLGEDSGFQTPEGKPIKLFPSPEKIANSKLVNLKTSSQRKETLRLFCQEIIKGNLVLDPTQDPIEFRKNVRAIRGIGPWSAEYMSLKVIRDPNAFPATDLILTRALAKHPLESIQMMSPWRGYAASLFWKEYYNA